MLFRRRAKKKFWLKIQHAIHPQKGWKRAFHYVLLRLKRLQGTPEYIARGFAIGVAINYWPILFTHLIFGFILCRMLKGNLISMFIGTLLGNPWTFAIVYPLSYKLGKVFLGLRPSHNLTSLDSAEEIWSRIWPVHSWDQLEIAFQDVILPMIIGGGLLAIPSALVGFYVVRNAIRVYRAQRRKKLQRHFDGNEADLEHHHMGTTD